MSFCFELRSMIEICLPTSKRKIIYKAENIVPTNKNSKNKAKQAAVSYK